MGTFYDVKDLNIILSNQFANFSCRTFCIQNALPSILHPIATIPSAEDNIEGVDLIAFTSLTRLFSYLHSAITSPGRPASATESPLPVAVGRIGNFCEADQPAFNETQKVDLCVTRQWIRILEWEYILRHFVVSYDSSDPVFSLFLPVKIGHEILSKFSTMDSASIRAHGYGMVSAIDFKLFDIYKLMRLSIGTQAIQNCR